MSGFFQKVTWQGIVTGVAGMFLLGWVLRNA